MAFEVAPLQLAPALVVGVMYWLRARTLAARGAPVPAWRQWCWYGGLALMVATLVSPLAHLSDELFLAHMVEHLLLADLGALLIVLGLTGPVLQPLLRAGCRGCGSSGTRSSRSRCWAANFYLWHLPALYQGAVEHDAVHALQHILFVSFGIAMWMALLGPLPKPAWFGNGCEDRLHRRRPADPERAGQRAAVVERRPVSALRGGRGATGASRPPTTRARRARS